MMYRMNIKITANRTDVLCIFGKERGRDDCVSLILFKRIVDLLIYSEKIKNIGRDLVGINVLGPDNFMKIYIDKQCRPYQPLFQKNARNLQVEELKEFFGILSAILKNIS